MRHILATSLHANLTKVPISQSTMRKGNFLPVCPSTPLISNIVLVIPLAGGKHLISKLCWTCPQPRFKVDEKVGLSSATVTIASYSSRCPSITAGTAIMVPETMDVENTRYTISYVCRIFDLKKMHSIAFC